MSQASTGAGVPRAAGAQPGPEGLGGASTAVDPEVVLEGEAYAPRSRMPRSLQDPMVRALLTFLVLCVVAGAVAGVLWNQLVPLPSYQVDAQGSATTSERGLTQVFATDAWFCLAGAVLGTAAGSLAWRWFRRLGWPVVLVATGGALLSGALCWWLGVLLGPNHFADRIAEAAAGDSVTVDFRLHAWSALLVWPFCATIPVLLRSALGADEQAAPRGRRLERAVLPTEAEQPRTNVTGATAPADQIPD